MNSLLQFGVDNGSNALGWSNFDAFTMRVSLLQSLNMIRDVFLKKYQQRNW
jgi:hypothetical protein